MRFRTSPLAVALAGALALTGVTGCDLVDPTQVDNPALTDDAILNTPRPLTGFLAGLDRQVSLAMNELVPIAEIGSDNYENTQTFFNSSFDNLDIRFQDTDVNALLFALSRLRELSLYGQTTVLAADEDATQNQEAELYFYQAVADLYLGQVFVAAPLEANGTPAEPEALIQSAIDALDRALELSTDADTEVGYRLLQARAHYALGDRANARALAQQVIDADEDYVRYARFGVDLNNEFEDAIYDRASFDDLQPLPRLDFLDPKYNETVGDDDIAYMKGEEAYLILIEAELADGDLDGAKALMTDLLDLVASRPTDTFADQTEGRANRPNGVSVVVRADADEPFLAGLVLDRTDATVTVPEISGTSVTDADVDALATPLEALRTLYLMRQEIFIAEGRRLIDLGIRLPLSENEQISNPNVDMGPLTMASIPAPIAGVRTLLDAFDVDGDQVTISLDVNQLLVDNRTDPALVPFF